MTGDGWFYLVMLENSHHGEGSNEVSQVGRPYNRDSLQGVWEVQDISIYKSASSYCQISPFQAGEKVSNKRQTLLV